MLGPKYLVGDTIIGIGGYGYPIDNKVGKIIAVRKMDDGRWRYSVQFDDYVDGHNAGGRGKNGHCWHLREENFRATSLFLNQVYNYIRRELS